MPAAINNLFAGVAGLQIIKCGQNGGQALVLHSKKPRKQCVFKAFRLALDIELDTGAQKAAIFSEIVCPGPCKG